MGVGVLVGVGGMGWVGWDGIRGRGGVCVREYSNSIRWHSKSDTI